MQSHYFLKLYNFNNSTFKFILSYSKNVHLRRISEKNLPWSNTAILHSEFVMYTFVFPFLSSKNIKTMDTSGYPKCAGLLKMSVLKKTL
jgi:hypothetical protein